MNNKANRVIGKRLRAFRKSTGMKGHELAEWIGISQGSLSDIENCKSDPASKTLVGLASKTDIDIYWLLTGKTDNKKNRVSI